MMMAARALHPAVLGAGTTAKPSAMPGAMTAVAPVATNAFRLAMLAIVLQFAVSSNLLYALGIKYDVSGGNPLEKFHPATYLVMLAAVSAMRGRVGGRSGIARMVHEAPAYAIFVVAMLVCSVYATISVGTSGAAIFVENHVSAALLAYVLEGGTAQGRRRAGRMILVLCLINVIVAIGETVTHTHLIPPYVGDKTFVEVEGDFRGTAGYAHPLVGAAATMMGLLCLPSLGLPALAAVPSFLLLCVGLLVFGGRTALAVSVVAMVLLTIGAMVRGFVVRRLDMKLIAAAVLAVLILPPLTYLLLNYTPIGERLVAHFYVDNSADVRSIQWRVLDQLSLRDALFGQPEDRIPFMVFTMNLDRAISDIESPWLLIFLKIGAFGCVFFLAGLIPFLARLWRRSAVTGRTLLVCGLVVISSSNTLGVKSNILFLLTAFIVTAGGFQGRNVLARTPASPPAKPAPSSVRGLLTLPPPKSGRAIRIAP